MSKFDWAALSLSQWCHVFTVTLSHKLRPTPAGHGFHAINRANARATVFSKAEDYAAFLRILAASALACGCWGGH
jgi:hypothetical protein